MTPPLSFFSVASTIRRAERYVDPLAALRLQDDLVISCLDNRHVSEALWFAMEPDLRFAMRPATEISLELTSLCAWCGERKVKVCAGCKCLRYCGRLCQRS